MKKRVKETIIGGVAIGAVGYLAGILTAPKKGSETRQDIKEAGIKTKVEAEKTFKKVHTELSELLKKTETLSRKGGTQAKAAVEQGKVVKGKVREVLSALHEGDAKDKDLKAVVEESSKAISHLKKYLEKDGKPS